MRTEEHLEALRVHGTNFARAAADAGLDTEVATCPGWLVADVVGHLGSVHRWAAAIMLAPPDSGRIGFPDPPADGRLDWYHDGFDQLLNVFAEAPDDLQCWTFLPGAPSAKAFWARRQAHETAMHRADVDDPARLAPDLPAPFAVDGIDELLFGFIGRPRSSVVADPPCRLLVQATDADARWLIRLRPDGRDIERDGEQPAEAADCVVRGAASDLYRVLWNRVPSTPPEVSGDRAVLERWHELARV
jgi:uncharacterized protein (TIGR03083 family)